MADSKLTALNEIGAALVGTDIFYVVDDPIGTPLSRKSLISRIYTYLAGSAYLNVHATGGIGYGTGAGGVATQGTNRTTGVQIDKASGAITLFSAAGSTTAASFTVTCSAVAATDVVIVSQKSGADKYDIGVTAVAAGSFEITFKTFSGTTTEQPVFNFAVIKAVAA